MKRVGIGKLIKEGLDGAWTSETGAIRGRKKGNNEERKGKSPCLFFSSLILFDFFFCFGGIEFAILHGFVFGCSLFAQ